MGVASQAFPMTKCQALPGLITPLTSWENEFGIGDGVDEAVGVGLADVVEVKNKINSRLITCDLP